MSWFKTKPKHLVAGRQAEKIAEKFLLAKGLKLIEKNFSCKTGEIDLVMRDEKMLVFVEVRYRKSTQFGLPQETVTTGKQKKIIRTAQYFILNEKISDKHACRFDIVGIHGTIPNHEINWIPNAFCTI